MAGSITSNQEIRELYERSISEKYRNDYEFRRWFSTSRLRLDYYMTRTVLNHHLKNVNFASCLEFGPGSGIFTATAFRRNPEARFDLIDISKAMKKQFELEMRPMPNINYMVGDIMSHEFNTRYELFYSVRAIEYVDDKERCFKKIHALIKEGGKGVVVTKNPHYGSTERGDGTRWQHTGKLGPQEMKAALEAAGFKNVQLYPAIVRLPIIERFTLRFTEKYFERVYRNSLSGVSSRFVESYLVTFEK